MQVLFTHEHFENEEFFPFGCLELNAGETDGREEKWFEQLRVRVRGCRGRAPVQRACRPGSHCLAELPASWGAPCLTGGPAC